MLFRLADNWLQRRLRPEGGPVVLEGNRIYIMPDANGLLCGLVLLALLVGSLNFSLSLGFVLTFLLVGVFLVSLLHTWRTLRGVRVSFGNAQPVFAGGQARFLVGLEDLDGRERRVVGVEPADGATPPAFADVPAHRMVRLPLLVPAAHRGWLSPGRTRLFTRYPLGVVVAWCYVEPRVRCLVYPAPESNHPPLPIHAAGLGEGKLMGEEGDDFAGLRPYRQGDSLRHVHWKAAARQEGLPVKQFAGQARAELWLEWGMLAGMGVEERLSRLCRWVLDAQRAGVRYGLRLPGTVIPPDHGDEHRHRCLEALALFPPGGAGS